MIKKFKLFEEWDKESATKALLSYGPYEKSRSNEFLKDGEFYTTDGGVITYKSKFVMVSPLGNARNAAEHLNRAYFAGVKGAGLPEPPTHPDWLGRNFMDKFIEAYQNGRNDIKRLVPEPKPALKIKEDSYDEEIWDF